jgi:integrase
MSTVVPLRREAIPKRQTPRRRKNSELRTREHLTEREVERLVEAARSNRHGHRDATMILVAFSHGLRVSELVNLRWDQIDFAAGNMHVQRRKNGVASTHPLRGIELRALRRLRREQKPASPFVFTSERKAPFSTEGFARLLGRAAKAVTAAERKRRQRNPLPHLKIFLQKHLPQKATPFLGQKPFLGRFLGEGA